MKLFGHMVVDQKFVQAMLVRAVKTFAQTALSLITVGAALEDIAWLHVLSISLVAAIYSVLTSVAGGLPETSEEEKETDGDILIDGMNYTLEADGDPYDWREKKQVVLNIRNIEGQKNAESDR